MKLRIVFIVMVAVSGLVVSCGDESTGPNIPPTTTIDSFELLEDQQYRAHITWSGRDPDGGVSYYEIAWQTGQVFLGAEDGLTWEKVTVVESTFTLSADVCDGGGGNTCTGSHTFFVRAVDNGGVADTSPPYRSFTTNTVLPVSRFVYPKPPETTQPECLRLSWRGTDADGEVVEYRMARKPYYESPEGEPPPEGSKWGEWTTSTDTVLANFYSNPYNPMTIFLQARDNAGAAEQVFDPLRNRLVVYVDEGLASTPLIIIYCYRGDCVGKMKSPIASCSNRNPGQMDVPVEVTAGDTLCFKSYAEPGPYATALTKLQYTFNNSRPGPYWDLPSDSSAWYYPSYGKGFTVPEGESTVYAHFKDNYCEWGSQSAAYMIIRGNPPEPNP